MKTATKKGNVLQRTKSSVLKSVTRVQQLTIYHFEVAINWQRFKQSLAGLLLWIYPIYVLIYSII